MTKTKTKITKRILCLMLCFVTAFCTLPINALAASHTIKYTKYTNLYSSTGYYYYSAYLSGYSSDTFQWVLYGFNSEDYFYTIPSKFSDLTAKTLVNTYSGTFYYMTNLNSYMKGTSSTKFSPDKTLTVAAAITILYRMAGSPSVSSYSNPFSDVKETDYYYSAALWAYNEGITTSTTFNGSAGVTRQRLATFLYRFAGKPYSSFYDSYSSQINDYNKISDYAKKAVLWCYYNDYLGLSSANNFNPNGKTITRIKAVWFFGCYGLNNNIGNYICRHYSPYYSYSTFKYDGTKYYYCTYCGSIGTSKYDGWLSPCTIKLKSSEYDFLTSELKQVVQYLS